MTDEEVRQRLGRRQMAMGAMITSPLYQPGLTSIGQRMPRDRGPDEARELRALARLAGDQELRPDDEAWQDSPEGKRMLTGVSPQEQEYLMRNMAYAKQQVAEALLRQQGR